MMRKGKGCQSLPSVAIWGATIPPIRPKRELAPIALPLCEIGSDGFRRRTDYFRSNIERVNCGFLPYFCWKHFSGVDKDKCKAENVILVRINSYKKNLEFAFLLTLQWRKTFQEEQGQFGTGAIARLHLGGQGDQGGGHHQGGRRQCRGVRRIPGDQVTSADGRSSQRPTGIDKVLIPGWKKTLVVGQHKEKGE